LNPLTDTHCHLASHRFAPEEIHDVVSRAREAGVGRIVTLATGLDDLEATLAVAGGHEGVHACLGIHPTDVHAQPDDAAEVIRPHLARPEVAAIGETGLDYYHPAPAGWGDEAIRMRQRAFLEQHFQLAAQAGLNLVIHTRDRQGNASFHDALAIYRRHAAKVRAVFHCFAGSLADAHAVIELGGIVSFGGVATFKNGGAVLDLASTLPLEQMMLETDAPYLAPHPHRGQRNEPAMVRFVAERIAEARDLSLESLARATSATAEAFFAFDRGMAETPPGFRRSTL
jgi:TatD DNase family protein